MSEQGKKLSSLMAGRERREKEEESLLGELIEGLGLNLLEAESLPGGRWKLIVGGREGAALQASMDVAESPGEEVTEDVEGLPLNPEGELDLEDVDESILDEKGAVVVEDVAGEGEDEDIWNFGLEEVDDDLIEDFSLPEVGGVLETEGKEDVARATEDEEEEPILAEEDEDEFGEVEDLNLPDLTALDIPEFGEGVEEEEEDVSGEGAIIPEMTGDEEEMKGVDLLGDMDLPALGDLDTEDDEEEEVMESSTAAEEIATVTETDEGETSVEFPGDLQEVEEESPAEQEEEKFRPPTTESRELKDILEAGSQGLRVQSQRKRKNPFREASDDPEDRAERLAHTLVSDMIGYKENVYREVLPQGGEAIREAFAEEIERARDEYLAQVEKDEVATYKDIFINAVNQQLGNGQIVLSATKKEGE